MSDTLAILNAVNEAQRIANAGYGFLTQATRTTNVGGIQTITSIMTTPSAIYRMGRAYRVTARGLMNATAADFAHLMLLKGAGTGGTVYVSQMRVQALSTSTSNVPIDFTSIITNTTGSDITTTLTLTAQNSTANIAQPTWTWAANATTAFSYVLVEDCGSTTNYAGFPMS